jgi:hypothetical protein
VLCCAGVAMAVQEFAGRVGRRVHLTNRLDLFNETHSMDTYQSWYMIK